MACAFVHTVTVQKAFQLSRIKAPPRNPGDLRACCALLSAYTTNGGMNRSARTRRRVTETNGISGSSAFDAARPPVPQVRGRHGNLSQVAPIVEAIAVFLPAVADVGTIVHRGDQDVLDARIDLRLRLFHRLAQ